MRNIYDALLKKAELQVLNSNDRDLFSNNFENIVYKEHRIETPYLDKPI